MKPFDLELAKAGHPVCIGMGKPIRILCFDKKDDKYPIVALIQDGTKEIVNCYTIDGHFSEKTTDCDLDLFMVSKKKEGWINIYSSGDNKNTCYGVYGTKEEALNHKMSDGYINTIKIEWEE